MIKIFFPLLILGFGCGVRSGNLLVNPSAEIPKHDSVPVGWENISGKWQALEGDTLHHDFGYAKDGKYYFFGGNGLHCVLQQDAAVSQYANDIDGGKLRVFLSGYEQTLDQGPVSDQGMLKVECLDMTKTKILYSDSTDTLMSIGKWKAIADTFLAPGLTRFIRVQLIAFRNVGGDNDGYFDDISLSASSPPNYILLVIIIVATLATVTGVTIYFRKKQKK